MHYKILALLLAVFLSFSFSKNITITECEDLSLIKSAYANDKGMHKYGNASEDTLMLSHWRC